MFNKKHLVDFGLVIIILIMGVFVYFQVSRIIKDVQGMTKATEAPQDTSVINQPTPSTEPEQSQSTSLAPDFELTSLDGDIVALSDYRGTAVMINFWAIWCAPCRDELPLIQAVADRHEDELVILAVNTGEDRTNVYHFVNEFNYDLVFLLDPSNSLASKYGVRGLPTSVFIDEEGLIQARHIGLLNELLLSDYLSQVGVVE